jgi:hypothetical protein
VFAYTLIAPFMCIQDVSGRAAMPFIPGGSVQVMGALVPGSGPAFLMAGAPPCQFTMSIGALSVMVPALVARPMTPMVPATAV